MASCLTDIINANKVDFIGLQETMKKNYKPSFLGDLTPIQILDGNGSHRLGNLVGFYVDRD